MLAAVCAAAIAQSDDALLDHAAQAWRSTPKMEIADAYKWLFQAVLGGEHAVRDAGGPRAWLEREWSAIGKPLEGEPELVRLTPGGSIVRVNLRPFKERGGDREMLLAVFVASAERFRGERGRFVQVWSRFGERLRTKPVGRIGFDDWRAFDRAARQRGYPAVHHSRAYERAYRPAYRVVLGSLWVGSPEADAP